MKFAILFPGQGSQFVGMGEELFETRPDLLEDRATRLLGWSLRDLCLEGPEDRLTRTENAQPALFALSFALWTILSDELDIQPSGAAGHSLGEYTALVAAGILDFDSALSVVAQRGQAMAEAADQEPSGMAALIGADRQTAEALFEERNRNGGRLTLANLNAPGQLVLAGGESDLEWLMENGKEFGIRRVIPLKVAGAFHSPFMRAAEDSVERALTEIDISDSKFPVWSNTTAKPHVQDQVKHRLATQVISPVLFSDSLLDMASTGIDVFIHVGPGDVTAGMARRTVTGAQVLTVSTLADIAPAVATLGTMS